MSDLKNQDDFVNFIRQKWGQQFGCPMCKQTAGFEISPKVFELREFHHGSIKLGQEKLFPVIPVTCKNCGNTIFINAIAADQIADESGKNDKK